MITNEKLQRYDAAFEKLQRYEAALVEEFFTNTVEERAKRAKAKLTDDDLDALGLKR